MVTRYSGEKCRIGLFSRIDYPGEGFRQALLELAADVFREEDCHYVVLAGGLISAKSVKDKLLKLKRKLTAAQKAIRAIERKKKQLEKSRKALPQADAKELKRLQNRVSSYQRRMAELEPEELGKQLAKLMPRFTDAKGDSVNLYIIPSPAYDGDVGEEVAHILAAKRKDVRVYSAGSDRMEVKQAGKILEVLTPEKAVWMRGDYYSTPIERVLKDKRKQSSRSAPDLQVIGCFASTITKPKGELPRPYASVPALHRIEEARVAENQIGVRVMSIHKDHTVPVLRTFNFKDLVSRERTFIGLPNKLSKRRRAIIDLLKEKGRTSTGILADEAGVSRETVEQELQGLVIRDGRPRKTWPGLFYDKDAKRWDFDLRWVQQHLRYPALPKEFKQDSIVAYGCLHAGSVNTDYRFFLEMIPKIILDRDATILVGAGDLVEGLKHNLALRGEVFGGINVTKQEALAGQMVGKVTVDVFRARFPGALAALTGGKKGPYDEATVRAAVDAALLTNILIPGNHDLWMTDFGWTPLAFLKATMRRCIVDSIERILVASGMCMHGLNDLVESKIVEPDKGKFTLPSGLQMTIMHPHMARAKTTSLRPQEMLDKAYDSPVVIGANFHVAEHLEVWDGEHGQRVCLQLGTLKHSTDFEDNKLKIVDQGFGYLGVYSHEGRILKTEATFYDNDPEHAVSLEPDALFKTLVKDLGLTDG